MVGRRHKDFRSGDLSEEMGVLLLKGIAAVATVPRPEDVGIDAIATLLREGPQRMLVAENSFYVQLKAFGKKKVIYVGHEVRWLEALRLPFFLGVVRMNEAALDLYATHRLSQVLLEKAWEEIHLYFEPTDEVRGGSDRRFAHIGPPLLSWSMHELANPDFSSRAYSILKPYLDTEQRNIEYRPIGYLENIHWETGQPPDCESGQTLLGSVSDEYALRVMRSMAPHLSAFYLRAMARNDREGLELYLRLANHMREAGFDPDPGGVRKAAIATLKGVRLGG
jgi:hypothetical protein